MNYFAIFLVFIFSFSSNKDWQLKKEKEGVQIFVRSVEGSSFLEFKAITVIKNSTVPEVLDVLLDVENYDHLYDDCINPKVLKRNGKYYDIHYIQNKGPFAVKDRDGVYEQIAELSSDEKYAAIHLKAMPDYIAENDDIVRIRKGIGFWELTETESNDVMVIYQFHGEPGGDIPAFLANKFVVSHPFNTINNLRILLKGSK